MEDRVVKLETKMEVIERDFAVMRQEHKEEMMKLTKALEDMKNEFAKFRQTNNQIKWLIAGAAATYFFKELGLDHVINIIRAAL